MNVTLTSLQKLHEQRRRFAATTSYDATFAAVLSRCGVECLIVEQDLASQKQPFGSPEYNARIIEYQTKNVASGLRVSGTSSWIVSDLARSIARMSIEEVIAKGIQLQIAGANMVRLEIDDLFVRNARALVQRGIPVCAHLSRLARTSIQVVIDKVRMTEVQMLSFDEREDVNIDKFGQEVPFCITMGLAQKRTYTTGILLPFTELLGIEGAVPFEGLGGEKKHEGGIERTVKEWVKSVKEL